MERISYLAYAYGKAVLENKRAPDSLECKVGCTGFP